MKGAILGYIYVVFLTYLHPVLALTCLNCDSVADPKFCTHVTKCFPGEECGTETSISQDGQVQYKLGCMDTNVCKIHFANSQAHGHQYFSCHNCCDDHDLCNVRGCNSTGFPANRGPICYNCESFPEGYPCHRITHCELHEVCYNDAHLEFQNDILYSSGCRSKHQCASESIDPMAGIGRRSLSVCTDCCKGDLCNLQCQKGSTCTDDSTCQLLMRSLDVCKTPDLAKQFCKKSCNLCATSGMTSCTDTRLDCAYINPGVNFCGTIQDATLYGCLKYCGFCQATTSGPGTTVAATTPSYSTTTAGPPVRSTLQTVPLLNVGDLVVRGPDWQFGNQDGNGTGMIVSFQGTNHLVQVHWDRTNTFQTYKYGFDGKLQVGDRVVRGPDWSWGDQDGHTTGVVTDVTSMKGWVTVRWANGFENSYRYGIQGFYDVEPVNTVHTTSAYSIPSTVGTTMVVTTQQTTASAYGFKVGDRVVRGPDWQWGDQDSGGQGTVIGVDQTGWVTVRWDNNFENSYRNGIRNAHDLQKISRSIPDTTSRVTVAPPTAGSGLVAAMYVGARVQRGIDWKYGSQDGNGPGTILSLPPNVTTGWAQVSWDNGYTNNYRLGKDNKYDIMFVNGGNSP